MKRLLTIVIATALLLGLPMLGAWVADLPLDRYLEFPPHSVYLEPAPFSWAAVVVFALLEILFYAPVAALVGSIRNRKSQISKFKPSGFHHSPFPIPHFLCLAWIATWWIIAWTRYDCFAAIQHHTFTPLWLGYIALVNAITFSRTGRCMITHERARLAGLFVASAAFWWFFEYLNRFVQNWRYEGVASFAPLEYFIFATLSFATVLPAVLDTAELLESFVLPTALTRCPVRLPPATRGGAWALLLVACIGLGGIGVWPDYFFPLLWLAPLLILTALRQMRGDATVFTPATHGDWHRIATLMTAALVCGIFWELWNFHSLAKWIYQVPYVYRWNLFEMPLLGFAGYLPFGLECAVIADLFGRKAPCGSN